MTTFNAGRSAWKLNQTQVISQGKIPVLQCKGRGWPGHRSCRMGARKEEAGGAAGAPGLPLFPHCVSRELRLGFAPLCSESAKLAQAQIAPKIGKKEDVFKKINKK